MLALTTDQVTRLTGFSSRELRDLEEAGVYSASCLVEYPRLPNSSVYSFQDAVVLRVINILLYTLHVERDELHRVGQFLRLSQDVPWENLTIRVDGEQVELRGPESDNASSGKQSGHAFVDLNLEEIAQDTAREAERLRERDPEEVGSITRHRNVNHHAWVIAGTRIPSSAIWNFHEAGYSVDDIIVEYPQLHPDDVAKAIAHELALKSAA